MKDRITTQTIVKNGEEFIREVLLSVKDYVKKMVVCDTGSTDNTVKIIEELIASGLNIELIKHGPFAGDWKTTIPELTNIRNEILNNCETDFMMIVDDDEIYTKEIFEELYDVIKDCNVMAVAIPFYNFVDRYSVLKESLYPCMKRVIRANNIEFRGNWPGESCYIKNEAKWLSNDDKRTKILKNKFYHYNLAKKTIYRPRQEQAASVIINNKEHDIVRFKGSQPDVFEHKIPWIVYDAKNMLDKIINSNFCIFEYGSGGSTFYFLERVKKLVTVEHDKEWYDKTLNTIKILDAKNHEYRLIEPQKISSNDNIDYSNYTSVPGVDLEDPKYFRGYHFTDYIFYIDKFNNNTFDLVFIDGFSRPLCITHAMNKIKSGGFLVFDNSEVLHYKNAISILKDWHRQDFFGNGPYLRAKWQTTIFRKP